MAGDHEKNELREKEIQAIRKESDKLNSEDIKMIRSAIDKQNQKIKTCKPFYLYCIAQYLENHYSFLRSLVICLYGYNNPNDPNSPQNQKYVQDIIKVFIDMFEVRWQDIGWRKMKYEYHNEKIKSVLDMKCSGNVSAREMYDCTSDGNRLNEIMIHKNNSQSEPKYKVTAPFLERCKKELKNLKCSQKSISEVSGLSLQKVKNLCRGKYTKTIKDSDLSKIANLLQCSKTNLFGFTENPYIVRDIKNLNSIEEKKFLVNFSKSNEDLVKLIDFLQSSDNEIFLEKLFLVTEILEETDAQYFIRLIDLLAVFLDKPQLYTVEGKTYVEYVFKNDENGKKPKRWKPKEYNVE